MKADQLFRAFSVAAVLAFSIAHAATIPVTKDSLVAGTTYNWTANNTYVLDGFCFVQAGTKLNIEAGTVIKAKPGTNAAASALIVCRDGRIYARGRIDKPIIFTAEADSIGDPKKIGFDPNSTKGLWGGIILCGRAPNSVNGQVMQAEGVPASFGHLIKYGDSLNVVNNWGAPLNLTDWTKNTSDTSGVLQYVSIRYPGSILDAGKEINGLTLCSVGKGTIIDHIEVFNSADDGFEWFGGTVDCKYLVSAFSDDDAFDYDQGYNGRCQFLFALQNSENGRANRLGEFDSDDGASNAGVLPYAKPVWYNCTFIGSGKTSANTLSDFGLIYKENAGGTFVNSILGDFRGWPVRIEDKAGTDVDARARFENGDIMIKNNIFVEFGHGDTLSDSSWIRDSLKNWNNLTANPLLVGISRSPDGKLDPRPGTGSPALVAANIAAKPEGDKFIVTTSFLGAFDPNDVWIRSWTLLAQAGFVTPRPSTQIDIYADSIKAGQTYNWTSDKQYVLNGFIFVPNGARLNIQAGTIVRGREGTGTSASALIVCRGGRIYAKGTPTAPIIFTAMAEDIDKPSALGFDASSTKGLWGGLILCGRAPNSVNGQVMQAEGVPASYGDLIKYGDSANVLNQSTGAPINAAAHTVNTYDTSGVLQYVSLRYGGSILDAGKEINGVTFCSVGKGTVVDHVETFNSADDGFEWFGGTVDCKYLVSAFSDDDAFDYDQGYNGNNQFMFAIQNSENGRANRLGEFDSDDGASNAGVLPYAKPVWSNCTYIGSGKASDNTLNDFGLIYKENAGGTFINSLLGDFRGWPVKIEDKAGTTVDARTRFEKGDIVIKNNIFFDCVNINGFSDSLWTNDSLKAMKNTIINGLLTGKISRTNNGGLVPQPIDSNAFSNLATLPSGGFFEAVPYKGAFGNENWADKWSMLSHAGFFGNFTSVVGVLPNTGKLNNKGSFSIKPHSNGLTAQFSLPSKGNVFIGLFSMDGKLAAKLFSGEKQAGKHVLTAGTKQLSNGVYLCRIVTPTYSAVKQVIVSK